jgi:6-phosphogluconolactonase/glucosamine-6-phosphate isomerase/deaminase
LESSNEPISRTRDSTPISQRSQKIGIYNTISPNFPTDRITCSAAMLLQAENIILMLSGEKKLNVFETSSENQLPISFFKDKLQVYYSI